MAISSSPATQRPTADLVLETTTSFGRRWSTTQIPASARMLRDPDHLLAAGDVITVHDPRDRTRPFLLKVKAREGDYALLRWLGRAG